MTQRWNGWGDEAIHPELGDHARETLVGLLGPGTAPRDATLTEVVAAVPAGLSQVYAVHGKYLRREGATNQPLAPDALRRLLLERGEVSWERSGPSPRIHT